MNDSYGDEYGELHAREREDAWGPKSALLQPIDAKDQASAPNVDANTFTVRETAVLEKFDMTGEEPRLWETIYIENGITTRRVKHGNAPSE